MQLDDSEDMTHVSLPAGYVGECVDYAYAVTANKAQGMTVDHVLFAPSAASSQETAYTALSRGRWSNHIYAIIGSGWEEALGVSKAHTFASDQQPSPDHNDRHAEPGQPDTDRGSDVRARLLAAHQASRGASAAASTVMPGWDVEGERARRERELREARRWKRDREEGGRNDGLHIGL